MAAQLSVVGPLLSSPDIRGQHRGDPFVGQQEAMAGPAKYCKCMCLGTNKKRNYTRKQPTNMVVSVSFIFCT